MIDRQQILACRSQIDHHLTNELLPFWLTRCKDDQYGGFITHFDKDGCDDQTDEKSLIAQTRTIFSMAGAHRHGLGDGLCEQLARHGVDFLIQHMWDNQYGGFFWTTDRKGFTKIDKKILYGHCFAIYALAEYTLATGDPAGLEFAEKTFDLIQKFAADGRHGGYLEMFERDFSLAGPHSQGGDRKTLDVHMHLMEALAHLYTCSRKEIHKQKLTEVIDILLGKMLHPTYGTSIAQFTCDFRVAEQIKFDIVWGWDRFEDGGSKRNPTDNTSYGHNVEFAWLLVEALNVLNRDLAPYKPILTKLLDHTVEFGIDYRYGGVFVEGPHHGPATDTEKEFWQQAETMIGMLCACELFDPDKYWPIYLNVHRFVFDKMINHPVGEWWPLLTREGKPIWTHMSHSWKVNYHTIRAMIQCSNRLNKLLQFAN